MQPRLRDPLVFPEMVQVRTEVAVRIGMVLVSFELAFIDNHAAGIVTIQGAGGFFMHDAPVFSDNFTPTWLMRSSKKACRIPVYAEFQKEDAV
ncbi:MAG: hypothetical protein P8Y51_09430 [Campylobacterales bacterium]